MFTKIPFLFVNCLFCSILLYIRRRGPAEGALVGMMFGLSLPGELLWSLPGSPDAEIAKGPTPADEARKSMIFWRFQEVQMKLTSLTASSSETTVPVGGEY